MSPRELAGDRRYEVVPLVHGLRAVVIYKDPAPQLPIEDNGWSWDAYVDTLDDSTRAKLGYGPREPEVAE